METAFVALARGQGRRGGGEGVLCLYVAGVRTINVGATVKSQPGLQPAGFHNWWQTPPEGVWVGDIPSCPCCAVLQPQ